uniref:leucine-rich repeat-containing protein 40 n=1 Tax=Erigeron canadensis TaxID=72917 RepID=UPI001CB8D198|nr:leucine-rich repeat-containing protein 40 [Erigeron canadensis]
MTTLTQQQVLQGNTTKTTDPNGVTSLTFTHRSISDVSCLVEFKNLERLDLSFNNLFSLEGLKPCVNLKWLSVKQNKLQSLKGIEGCVCLTVLNAGNNLLQSIDEVSNLVRLRALILNDNEIYSICKLDQMKELNTLVLSKNPIRKFGDCLGKVNSITKLSLSKCKIQCIDPSITSCKLLRELRLAHNEIRTLPNELIQNTKIQNLDLGNNLIMRWSDIKILSSLTNLKNLNLVANPVAEKDVAKKIKKLVPSLQIFNARPIDKTTKNVTVGADDNHMVDAAGYIEKKMPQKIEKNITDKPTKFNNEEKSTLVVLNSDKKSKRKSSDLKDKLVSEEEAITKSKKVKHDEDNKLDKEEETITKSKKIKHDEETVHHDFTESNEKRDDGAAGKMKKKIRSKRGGSFAVHLLSPEADVGSGGPSAWDVDG